MSDDVVERELDVYLSSDLSEFLHLFQFPVRNEPLTGESCPVDARMKPLSQTIELNIPIDTKLPTYNANRGAELGIGLDDTPIKTADMGLSNSQNSKLFDRQSIVSQLLPCQTHYFVGAVQNEELHLSKIKGVAQFRPSFSAIDKINEKMANANKRPEKPTTSASKAVQVQVQVRKTNLTNQEIQRKGLIDHINQQKEEEWQKLKYFSLESEKWDSAHQHLFCKDKDKKIQPKESRKEYLKLISS